MKRASATAHRFRVLRCNWRPDPESEPGDFFSPSPDEDISGPLVVATAEDLQRLDYPWPASLLDVPPEVSCFASFPGRKQQYTREHALRLVARMNLRQMRHPSLTMLWHLAIENLGFDCSETFVQLHPLECFEDRFRRYRLRIVEPTVWEVSKYGDADDVAVLIRRKT